MLHPHSQKSKGLVIGSSPCSIFYMSNPSNIWADDYSPSLVTSTKNPVSSHNVSLPQVLGQQLGPSPFSRKFPVWKVHIAAALRSSTLSAILSGFPGSWSVVERPKPTVLVFQSPRRLLLNPLFTTISSDTQLLKRTCSGSLHVTLGTLVFETPPSSYPSSLQFSEGRHECANFPSARGCFHMQGSLS